MARSSYIYILYNINDDLEGAFTVLHELKTFVERNPGSYYAHRYRDGQPETVATEVDLKKGEKCTAS